jgi:ring-1,2-phenylacetyl-CoA epoxidase subunit PaaC
MQSALNEMWPYALGMFEPGPFESDLISDGVFIGEQALQAQWMGFVGDVLRDANLVIPEGVQAVYGGRNGYHTDYLQPLLDEMTEVFRIDPSAEW